MPVAGKLSVVGVQISTLAFFHTLFLVRRIDDEFHKLNQNHIFCPEVAEIENLFLLPEVIKLVAESLQYDVQQTENILTNVKKKTFAVLSNHLDEQALLFTRQEVQNKISATTKPSEIRRL